MASSTITLPAIGKVPKTYAYAGGAAVVGIGVYAWITRRSQADIPDVAPDADAAYDAFGNPIEGPGSVPDYVPPTTTNPGGNYSEGEGITTNAAWTQAATEYLISLGYNAVSVSSALGKFLGRQQLNTVEVDTVRAALGAQGEPPQGGPWVIIPEVGTPASVAVGAVTNLRKTSSTNTSITLGWMAASGATSYQVTRSGGGVATRTGTSHTSSNLKPGTTYTFTVRGRNAAGNLGPAVTISAATSGGNTLPPGSTPGTGAALAAPPNLRATTVSRTAVTLVWDAVPGAKTYVLTRQGGGRGLNRPTRSHTSGGLKPNTTYTFLVRAVDGSGKSGPSNVLTVKTKP